MCAFSVSLYCGLLLHSRSCICFYFSPPISDYDVFNEGKTQSFFESQQAVIALCTYLEDINKTAKELSENQLFEHFQTLLRVSILYISTIHDNQLSAVVSILVSNVVQLLMSTVKWFLVVRKPLNSALPLSFSDHFAVFKGTCYSKCVQKMDILCD